MKTIEMVAKIGDQTLTVGKCNSAQARVLVKNEHAAWLDGKILLPLDPELLRVAVNQDRGPLDDSNVSKKELERRMAWLASLVETLAHARSRRSDLDHIVGRPVMTEFPIVTDEPTVQEPDPDDAEWYADTTDPVNELPDEMWPAAPNVSAHFEVPGPSDRVHTGRPPAFDMEAAIRATLDRNYMEGVRVTAEPGFHNAKWARAVVTGLGPPQRTFSPDREVVRAEIDAWKTQQPVGGARIADLYEDED